MTPEEEYDRQNDDEEEQGVDGYAQYHRHRCYEQGNEDVEKHLTQPFGNATEVVLVAIPSQTGQESIAALRSVAGQEGLVGRPGGGSAAGRKGDQMPAGLA